jgi:hypothetical protein
MVDQFRYFTAHMYILPLRNNAASGSEQILKRFKR